MEVFIYGASTKGNTLLQYYGINNDLIKTGNISRNIKLDFIQITKHISGDIPNIIFVKIQIFHLLYIISI